MFSSPSPPPPLPPPPNHAASRGGNPHQEQHFAKEIYDDEDDDEEEEENEEEQEEEVGSGADLTRVVTTVPAREPKMDALPLKPALKKPRDANGRTSNGTGSDKNQSSSLGGRERRGVQYQ